MLEILHREQVPLTGTRAVVVGRSTVVGKPAAGDVDPDGAEQAAGLTPVPGGVGPVTTMLLMRHTA